MRFFLNIFKSFVLLLKFIQASSEEKEDEEKEHEKITTDECASYGTLDQDQEMATKKDVCPCVKINL